MCVLEHRSQNRSKMIVSIIAESLANLDLFPKDLCNIIAAYGCSIMFNASGFGEWHITSEKATLTKLNNTWTMHYCYSDAISEIPQKLHKFDLKFNSQSQYPNWISIDFEPPFYWNTDNEVRWRSMYFNQSSFVIHCKIITSASSSSSSISSGEPREWGRVKIKHSSWTLDMWSSDAIVYDFSNSTKKSIQYTMNDGCREPCVKLELFHSGDSVQVTYV